MHEFQADAYSVKIGYGPEQYSALIRNFAQNKDIVFKSKLAEWISDSHPSLLERLTEIEKMNKKTKERERAPEIHLKLDDSTADRPNRLQGVVETVELSSIQDVSNNDIKQNMVAA